MMDNNSGSRLVYSTQEGRICPECAKPAAGCICGQVKKTAVPQNIGVLRIRYENNRKGKGMTLISGLGLNETGLLDLAKKLKQRLATGGSVKEYTIQLQGDFRKQAELELSKMGLL